MRRQTWMIGAAMLLLAPATAQSEGIKDDPRMQTAIAVTQAWLKGRVDYLRLPGLSAGYVHGDELVWAAGIGYQDVATQTPATADTLYGICSISKLFTSISLMQLRDAGKLLLSDRVADHLDWFDIKQQYADSAPITIERLITHTSGLPRESDFPYWTGPVHHFPTHDQIAARLGEQETLYPSATYWQYSNLALTLAGEIVAQASGEDYHHYVRTHVLDPLGMNATFSEHPIDRTDVPLATPYTARFRGDTREEIEPYTVNGIDPAAGFTSSVNDMAKFASWQLDLLKDGGDRVLNVNTLKEMQRVHWTETGSKNFEMGLGFFVYHAGGIEAVGHGGSCPGYLTAFLLRPKEGDAAIGMINANGDAPGGMANVILHIMGDAAAAIEKDPDGGVANNPDLEKFAGRYESHPWGGDEGIFVSGDDLVVYSLNSTTPQESRELLKHVDGNVFRRQRDDGAPGEAWTFLADGDGNITGVKAHSNIDVKVE